ncbi:MAG: hypothetical protein ABIS20_18485 [Thermoanaerobaculia bacterium]
MEKNKMMSCAVFAAAMLMLAGCHGQSIQTGRIGEIDGTVSWSFRGEIGEDRTPLGVNDAITIMPVTVITIPPTRPGTFGQAIDTAISGTEVNFGKISVSAKGVSVPYAVTKLPSEVSIQLRVLPKVGGQFLRDGNPQDAVLTVANPIVTGFNFNYATPPK